MFSRGIVAAMEDEAQAAELAIDEAGSDSMEADLVEVVDMSSDIEAGTDDMNQTVADADQLERHVEVLTDAEGEGGASPELIEATEIAVEAIYARLGIYKPTGIPALESFSTKTGRARNTRIAIEVMGIDLKKIWEAVKLAFTKLVNYVKDFFAKLFDANTKMLARANSLEAKIKTLKGEPKDKVKGKGIGTVFGANVKDAINDFNDPKNLSQVFSWAVGLSTDVTELVSGVGSQTTYNGVKFEPMGGKPAGNISAPDDMQWVILETVGVTDIIMMTPKKTMAGEHAYTAYSKIQIKTVKSTGKTANDSEIEALTRSEMTTILSSVRSVVKSLMDKKTEIAKLQANLQKSVAEISQLASGAGKEDEDVGKRSTRARSAVTTVGNNSIKLVTIVGSEVTRGVQAALTYVERSISAHKEAPDTEA